MKVKVSIEKATSGEPFVIKDETGKILHDKSANITDINTAFHVVEKYGYEVMRVIDPDVQAY